LDPVLRRYGVTHIRKPIEFGDLLQLLEGNTVH
jgi:hypothetical protein